MVVNLYANAVVGAGQVGAGRRRRARHHGGACWGGRAAVGAVVPAVQTAASDQTVDVKAEVGFGRGAV